MSKVLEGLRYSEDHEWAKVEDGVALVGISDYAQHELRYAVRFGAAEALDLGVAAARLAGDYDEAYTVTITREEDEAVAGEEFGALESVKASSELLSPVSGKIVACNAELEDAPEKINEDPYGTWIIKVEMSDPAELDALMDAEAYKAFIQE